MKKAIKTTAILIIAIMLGTLKCQFVLASDGYEIEGNDSYILANVLDVNASVSGNLSNYDDVDYYKIIPNANGKIEITFEHTYEESYDDWNVYTYIYTSGEYIELSSTNIDLNSDERVSIPFIGATSNNVYYIKVERCCEGVLGVNYRINTSFMPSDYYEKEINDVYSTATELTLNNRYCGNIASYDDVDYYKIVPSSNGKIELLFNHVYEDSYDDWNIYTYLYNAGQYVELSNTNVDLNGNEKVILPYIGAVNDGVYYIKVEKCCDGVVGVEYSIETSFKSSDYYEKEINDVYGSATTVSLGKSYDGNISSYDDKDYYKFVAPASGQFKIDFAHAYEDSYDDWNVYVYKASNGQYTELSNTNVDLNSKSTCTLPLIGTSNNGVYYIKVEKCCDGVIGKNYTLKIQMSANAPSNLQSMSTKKYIKLSWGKVNGADGYEVYCKTAGETRYKKYKTTKATSIKYTKAKMGKSYYFKVRSYVIYDGEKYYSSYSNVKKAKLK